MKVIDYIYKAKGVFIILKILKKLLILILVIFAILCGVVYGISQAKYDGDIKKAIASMVSETLGGVETKYVLIMGVSEDIKTELTDTIMLAGYNPDTAKAFLVSIPRDTFVGKSKSKAKAVDKINAQYSNKGVEETISAVENLTGVGIDDYIVVKTSMLVQIVDLIGGVEFDVPINMNYDDPTQNLHIHLSKGLQTIDGDKAEQLLRFRHNKNGTSYSSDYGDNDFGRMRTQREFMKATAKQTLTLSNVPKIKDIINTVSSNLITDFSTKEMIAYVPQLAVFNADTLVMEQIPGTTSMINKISFFLADEDETKEMMKTILEDFNTK